MTFRTLMLLFLTLLLAGCAQQPADNAVPTASHSVASTELATATTTTTSTPTATASATPSPTPTATVTPTPSPTPTPTPTAVPLTASGDPRAPLLSDPVPHSRNLCGLVDVLDFPLDPPDAANVSRGGTDFGIFRDRFDKFHAGEDWRGPDGAPSLGAPVYAIGHGVVTYAQPLGWGRDQGVVIVQHSFATGGSILSFYGHLDPESITLLPGDCVARGQQVGAIGDPRSSPHLHFEIRTQAPYATLTGYWPEDPTTQGWLPPSQTIWEQRLSVAPGVAWTRPFTPTTTPIAIGPIATDTVALLENEQLLALNTTSGSTQPISLALDTIATAAIHDNMLFVANRLGQLDAVTLPDLTPLWTAVLNTNGAATLLPLPDGGVLANIRSDLFAIDSAGQVAWQAELGGRPFHHTTAANTLFLTTGGDTPALWQIANGQPPQKLADIGGRLVSSGDYLWIYSSDGLYRLPLTQPTPAPERMLALPTAFLTQSDILPLPDGGVLLAHRDIFDSRLIAIGGDGSLRWDRSITDAAGAAAMAVEMHLLSVQGQPYLLTQATRNSAATVAIFGIQDAPLRLTHLFTGGTRSAIPSATWAMPVSTDTHTLLLNIGGGHLLAFLPETAVSLLAQAD